MSSYILLPRSSFFDDFAIFFEVRSVLYVVCPSTLISQICLTQMSFASKMSLTQQRWLSYIITDWSLVMSWRLIDYYFQLFVVFSNSWDWPALFLCLYNAHLMCQSVAIMFQTSILLEVSLLKHVLWKALIFYAWFSAWTLKTMLFWKGLCMLLLEVLHTTCFKRKNLLFANYDQTLKNGPPLFSRGKSTRN
jgi:hypothetical protein